jgi:hypothetical protein
MASFTTIAPIHSSDGTNSVIVPAWKLEAKRKARAERIKLASSTIAAGQGPDQEATAAP